ncbi:hypothetical protein QFZ79_002023 [Arthrobacter sp. V4I6]|uniref:resistance to Congo red protein n=1 Tax=unclassified Arthrobacter TaxID=235627 RepID=UPI00278703F3|nr:MULTISPECIES: resistance to Congo red protein [unclassified Arthrobacter]MDQ0819733.1 hypothetical protein [Arthrobacter sp. V1I7]MDQ0853912.1 hypothetical protein [Arthrobacter sp. V4I6]
MSIPPVPPSSPDGPVPGEPTPQYGQNAPQYGQQTPPTPPYGQNAPQYGQNAPQYGQQTPPTPPYGQNAPQYGQSPYAQYSAGQQQTGDGVPKLVNIAFWLIVASGVLWLLSLLLSIGTLDTPAVRDMFQEQMAASGADVNFNDIRPFLVGTIVVFAVISTALYALVALNVRKGKNWARILGTVFAALSVFSLFPLSIGTLAVLAGIAGIVMLYLPATSPYFRKQQPFANPYAQPGGPFRN